MNQPIDILSGRLLGYANLMQLRFTLVPNSKAPAKSGRLRMDINSVSTFYDENIPNFET